MARRLDETSTLDTLPAKDGDQARAPDELALPSRYEDQGVIASGGMGEVRRVLDGKLGRPVAMKIIKAAATASLPSRRRFEAEARLTSRLQHPAIVPVHDVGVLPDGRLWFTMREVRGVTLEVLIDAVHAASADGPWTHAEGWTLRRLVGVWESVCLAVAYAHEEGVIHRDLKPANVMVGPFGEVQVMDWGIAKLGEAVASEAAPAGRRAEDPPPVETMVGTVMGTPAYMAPEQATGRTELHGPCTDIWALGAILYTIVRGERPFSGDTWTILRRVARGAYEPLPDDGLPPVPQELRELIGWSMALDPGDRPASAATLAEAARAWLDGSARRARARALMASVERQAESAEAARAESSELRARAAVLLDDTRPHDPVEAKTPAWDLEARAEELDQAAAFAETRYVQGLRASLDLYPELDEAHAALADHYRRRMTEAEQGRRLADTVRYEELLRAHDCGRHAGWLRGEGELTLVTEPPGAEVRVTRLVRRRRRLEPGPEQALGTSPTVGQRLLHGSWVATLRAPGRTTVSYPIALGREEHWDGVRPGATEAAPVALPPAGELGPEDHLVAAGWFLSGGDEDAVDPLPPRRLWVDAFVVRRHSVTVAEYIAFLDALTAEGREEEVYRYLPVQQAGLSGEPRAILDVDEGGSWQPGTLSWGAPLTLRMPVPCVDWHSARAFAAWEAERTGQPWRLLHELEWEKAARGVDGRRFPWGDHLDPTWACMQLSHAGRPALAEVTEFEGDVSPYGVRGLAGGIRDWCLNGYTRVGQPDGSVVMPTDVEADPAYRVVRGGAWSGTARVCRAASRVAAEPDTRMTGIGFRLGRSSG